MIIWSDISIGNRIQLSRCHMRTMKVRATISKWVAKSWTRSKIFCKGCFSANCRMLLLSNLQNGIKWIRVKNRKICAHADERSVRGKALCALDGLKQQGPAVFLPINYFIFTFIFSIGWSFFILSLDRSTSRVQNHKSKKKRTNKKLPPFLFLHVLVNTGFCDIAIWSLKLWRGRYY